MFLDPKVAICLVIFLAFQTVWSLCTRSAFDCKPSNFRRSVWKLLQRIEYRIGRAFINLEVCLPALYIAYLILTPHLTPFFHLYNIYERSNFLADKTAERSATAERVHRPITNYRVLQTQQQQGFVNSSLISDRHWNDTRQTAEQDVWDKTIHHICLELAGNTL